MLHWWSANVWLYKCSGFSGCFCRGFNCLRLWAHDNPHPSPRLFHALPHLILSGPKWVTIAPKEVKSTILWTWNEFTKANQQNKRIIFQIFPLMCQINVEKADKKIWDRACWGSALQRGWGRGQTEGPWLGHCPSCTCEDQILQFFGSLRLNKFLFQVLAQCEGDYSSANTNKLQHLQLPGPWWWGWNLSQIHCPWSGMGSLTWSGKQRLQGASEPGWVSAGTSVTCC